MKYKIIPTVFSHDNEEFKERFLKLVKISKDIQIDIMDGKFVKAKSISVSTIPNLRRYKNNFEAHLMVKNPVGYIKMLKERGFEKVIFHYNTDDPVKLIAEARKAGMKVFLGLNPEVKIEEVCYLFPLLDGALLMGHNPGKEHLKLSDSTFKKIREIRKIDKKIDIQIDGGVNSSNIRKLFLSGANLFNIGSFVAESGSPAKSLKELKNNLKK